MSLFRRQAMNGRCLTPNLSMVAHRHVGGNESRTGHRAAKFSIPITPLTGTLS